jgi:hypothetical protein
VVKPNECRCLCEGKEKMLEKNMHDRCLTEHPAFDIGCLNHWVLKRAVAFVRRHNFEQKTA